MPKKILLADDSLTIQKVVELTLAGTDYELTCVSNGQKALESFEHSRPDLILADVVMPGKNGYEVCEAVKSDPTTARIPVVLLSGTFEPFDRDRADRIGADRVVSKPFDAQELLDEIETLLTRAASTPFPASALEEGPFDTAFLDDMAPTTGAPGESEPIEAENPFEHLSPLPPPSLLELRRSPGESQGLPSDWSSNALAKEEALAEEGEGSAIAEEELTGAEGFSGGPVFLPPPDTQAAAEEAETRHPVEETSSEPPRAEPPPEQVAVEEIPTEAAETLFEVPAALPPPASPAPVATELTQEQIERIATLVVAKLSEQVLREIAREVVPDVAEMVVKRRIEELENGAE